MRNIEAVITWEIWEMSRFLPWDDADYIEIPLTTTDEVRYMVIGMVEGKVWSGIITYRSESIRIISVRRSRKEEIELYEG